MTKPQPTAPFGYCPDCSKPMRVRNAKLYCFKCDREFEDVQAQDEVIEWLKSKIANSPYWAMSENQRAQVLLDQLRAASAEQGATIERLRKALDRINTMACYASEENTGSKDDILLSIGRDAREMLKETE